MPRLQTMRHAVKTTSDRIGVRVKRVPLTAWVHPPAICIVKYIVTGYIAVRNMPSPAEIWTGERGEGGEFTYAPTPTMKLR